MIKRKCNGIIGRKKVRHGGKTKASHGNEDVGEMRKEGYYYIDKRGLGLVKTLLENFGKVNLFTHPRRRDSCFFRTAKG